MDALYAFRVDEFKVHCEAMLRGLSSIVPYPMLSLFTWSELELQVCGRPTMNLDLLKSMTTYEWCSPTDPHIVAFWEVMFNRSILTCRAIGVWVGKLMVLRLSGSTTWSVAIS